MARLLRQAEAPAVAVEPLRRRGDGELFPPGPVVTWTVPVGAGWIEEFLRFFGFGPPAPVADGAHGEDGGDRCRFNFAPATVPEVLDTVGAQRRQWACRGS